MIGLVLGKLLSDLIELRSQGKLSVGMEVVMQSLKSELNIDIEELIDIPKDKFINFLQTSKNYENDSLSKLAEIFIVCQPYRR